MTLDKIKHYLSEPIFNHISELNQEQLKQQKDALTTHIEYLKQYAHDFYFKNQIKILAEMEFINHRLT